MIRTDLENRNFLQKKINFFKQECIPVGCVPPARYRTEGGSRGGLCPGGVSLTKPLLWTEWLTDRCKNITLPLRAVINRKNRRYDSLLESLSNPHQFFPRQLLLATLYSNTQSQFCLLMIQSLNNRNSSRQLKNIHFCLCFILNTLLFQWKHNDSVSIVWLCVFVISIVKTWTIVGYIYILE